MGAGIRFDFDFGFVDGRMGLARLDELGCCSFRGVEMVIFLF